MNKRRWLALIGAVAALHIAIRIPLLNEPVWVDEPVAMLFATQPLSEAWRLAPDTYSPPGLLMAMSAWGETLRLLGWETDMPREGIEWFARNPDRSYHITIPLEDGGVYQGTLGIEEIQRWRLLPIPAIRITSLGISILILLVAMIFARRATGSPGLGLAVGILLAVAPAVARWDTIARYLSPVVFPVLLQVILLWEIASAPRLRARWWLLPLLMIVTALALLTHYVAALFAPWLGLWLLLTCGRGHWRRTVGAGVAMVAGLGIFLLIWGPGLHEQWAGSGLVTDTSPATLSWPDRFPLQPVLPMQLLLGMDGQTAVFDLFPAWWIHGLQILLLIACAGYLIRLLRGGGTRLDLLLLLWLFGAPTLAVVIEIIKPNTVGVAWRQHMSGAPAAALLFALGLQTIGTLVQRTRQRA